MNIPTIHTRRLAPLADYRPRLLPGEGMRESAVLIPVVSGKSAQILFTLRSRHLNNHAGQISFPGGGIEPGEDPLSAALREAQEEIGLDPKTVATAGRLDDVTSPHGFHIRCYVGLCPPFEPRLNQVEVESLVVVGMDELFDEKRHEIRKWRDRDVHFFHFEQGIVWGVTGLITYRLRQVLGA